MNVLAELGVHSILGIAAFAPAGHAQSMYLASTSTAGQQGNGLTGTTVMSADGRFIAFRSEASNLVGHDNNAVSDVFRKDRQTGVLIRASLSSAGIEGDSDSGNTLAISGSGRFIAFETSADDLASGDADQDADIVLRDCDLNTTMLVSLSDPSDPTPAHGGDMPAFSGNERFVSFRSVRSLVANDQTTGDSGADVYLHDLQLGTTELISVSLTGVAGDGRSGRSYVSFDGRYVAFTSAADDLVPSDTNGVEDVFLRDREAGMTTRLSVSPVGDQASAASTVAAMTRDARYVVFHTDAPEIKQGYPSGLERLDRTTGIIQSVSLNFGTGNTSAISDDGRFVVIDKLTGLGSPGLYFRDMFVLSVEWVDAGPDGGVSDGDCLPLPAISGDGRYVAFTSFANNLMPDTNGTWDSYVRDMQKPTVPWDNLGKGTGGSAGVPILKAAGSLAPSSVVSVSLTSAKGFAPSWLIAGVSYLDAPFKGGVIVPDPNLMFALTTDFFGDSTFGGVWPAGIPSGFTIYFQWWIQDPAGLKGFAASNAVAGTTP